MERVSLGWVCFDCVGIEDLKPGILAGLSDSMAKLLARGFDSFARFSHLALPADYSERKALKTLSCHYKAFEKPADYLSVSEYRRRYDPLTGDFPSSMSTLTGTDPSRSLLAGISRIARTC
jgi:hypothetical protein